MPASLRWGAATHPGQVRMNNEDAYAADDGMWVVADGMGGHLAGEVASAYTIDALRAANRVGITSSSDMVEAVQQANDTIRHEAQTNPGRRGMGTTVTALAVMHHPDNPQLVVANVGDSRTYLWRDGQLLSVTVDHSYVQELVSGGEITVDEARTHPRRNIVTRALGIEPGVIVDTWTLAAVRGDRYILCRRPPSGWWPSPTTTVAATT
jgi:serine/threonine protein phosphatase PrpC